MKYWKLLLPVLALLALPASAQMGGGIYNGSGGGGGDTITSPNSTLTIGGTATNTTIDFNLGHSNTWTAEQIFNPTVAVTASTVTRGTYFTPTITLPGSANVGAIPIGAQISQTVTGNGSNVSGGDNLGFLVQNNFNGTGTMPYFKGIESQAVNNGVGTLTGANSYYTNVANGGGGTITTYVMYGGLLGTNNGTIGTMVHFGCSATAGGQTPPISEYCLYNPDSTQLISTAGPIGAQTFNATNPGLTFGFTLDGTNAISIPTNDTTEGNSLAVGKLALSGQTGGNAGYSNVAVGSGALGGATLTTAATFNDALGVSAIKNCTSCNQNTAIGHAAGFNLSTGVGNTFGGFLAGGANGGTLTGSNNTGFGSNNLQNVTGAATSNLGFGFSACSSVTTGSSNVCLGPSVGSTVLTTGSSNILIGTSNATTTAAAATSNFLSIGGILTGDTTTGNVALNLASTTNSVNSVGLTPGATGVGPTLAPVGETNVPFNINGKGTGGVVLGGTSTNDDAAAGKVGEYLTCSANNNLTATVTITIASPGVITWTAHGLKANAPVTLTTSSALPTGFTAGTTYYVVGSSITTNTFTLATTIANAVAGTAINTSGSQSGTQTGTNSVSLTNNTNANVCGITLTAGDWDVWGNVRFAANALTTASLFQGGINTTSATLGFNGALTVLPLSVSAAGTEPAFQVGTLRVSTASTIPVYLVDFSTFATSTMNGEGFIAARRRR